MQTVGVVQLQLALEDQVVDLCVAMLTPVATAHTGIQQGAAQAVFIGAADQQIGAVLQTILARRWADLGFAWRP